MFLCGAEQIARLCDAKNGKQLVRYSYKNKRYELYAPIFSPDSRRIVFTNNTSTIRILDTITGETLEFPMQKLDAVPLGWSCNGKLVFVSVKNKLLFLDSANGNIVREISIPKGVAGFAKLSSDEQLLILGIWRNYSSFLQVIRLDTNETLYEKNLFKYQKCDRISAVFLNNETNFSIAGQDIVIIDINGFKEIKRFEGFEGSIEGFTMIPPMEKEMIISDNGIGRIIDLESGKETGRFKEPVFLSEKTTITPDGKIILLPCENDIGIFDIPSRKLIKKFSGFEAQLVISPDFSKVIVEKEKTQIVYRIADGKKLYHLKGVNNDTLETVAFSADSRLILMSDCSFGVRMFNATDGQLLHELVLEKDRHRPDVGFIGNGSHYFIRSDFNRIDIYETATYKQTITVQKRALPYRNNLIISPDCSFFIGHDNLKAVEIVDLPTGRTIRTDPLGEKNLSCFAHDLPRKRLYYGAVDGTIRIMNTTNWQWTHTIKGIGQKINRLYVSPKGHRMAAQHLDGVVIFDTETMNSLGTIPVLSDKQFVMAPSILFSPTWKHAVKICESSVLVFDLP
ncbi:MAG: WD40 repeat domain-containing protein [Planctomycetaceae bacterium]|nr:WD40 repeat domain-containing protein [Planctomycetaceae bacterium]